MRIISFIDQRDVIIHAKRSSIAHELHPAQNSIKASFNCVLNLMVGFTYMEWILFHYHIDTLDHVVTHTAEIPRLNCRLHVTYGVFGADA